MRILKILGIIFLSVFSLSNRQVPDDNSTTLNIQYLAQLIQLKATILHLQEIIEKDENNSLQQAAFKNSRLAYKQLSVFTDYFNPYETILLNSPAIERVEEDNFHTIINPHGFQQLESLIWSSEVSDSSKFLKLFETNYILEVIKMLEDEPDRIYKFNDERVWEAMRISLITVVTKTIAGFDSPLAQISIEEAGATLRGVESIIKLYNESPGYKNHRIIKTILLNLSLADQYLKNNASSFNDFDRLHFIKEVVNPISNSLTDAVIDFGLANANERKPLQPLAPNIFSKNAFDVNFFSPNQRYQSTPKRIALGKNLFFDKQLSGNGTRSCASCHQPELAFTDGVKTPFAIDNVTLLSRNTPTLLNAVFQTKQFYDSRQPMLEFQVSSVIHSEKEMGGSMEIFAETIRHQNKYTTLFKEAYPDIIDPVTTYTIANAIASYIRSLQSMNAKFDQYMRNEPVGFSRSEKKGFNLYMGKAKCGTCHFIPLFNGLLPPMFNDTESEVIGVPEAIGKNAKLDPDSGKYYFTGSKIHLFSFKTPTVRNIALTAPYMHNGIFNTLEEVIDFYNDGGGNGLGIAPPNQTLPFEKLDLSKKEKKDLIAFLKTLTDTSLNTYTSQFRE